MARLYKGMNLSNFASFNIYEENEKILNRQIETKFNIDTRNSNNVNNVC